MFQLRSVGTHSGLLSQTGLISSVPAKRMGRPVQRTPTEWWSILTGKRNIGRDLTHTGLYVIESDHASSTPVISSIHPDTSFISTPGGISSSALPTGQSSQPLTRVADIQISATGGDVTERTSLQNRRVSTVTVLG